MDSKLKLIIFSLSLAVSLSAYFLFWSKASDLSVETEISLANCLEGSALVGCAQSATLNIAAPNPESSVDLLSSLEATKAQAPRSTKNPMGMAKSVAQSPTKTNKIVVPKSEAAIETTTIK